MDKQISSKTLELIRKLINEVDSFINECEKKKKDSGKLTKEKAKQAMAQTEEFCTTA